MNATFNIANIAATKSGGLKLLISARTNVWMFKIRRSGLIVIKDYYPP